MLCSPHAKHLASIHQSLEAQKTVGRRRGGCGAFLGWARCHLIHRPRNRGQQPRASPAWRDSRRQQPNTNKRGQIPPNNPIFQWLRREQGSQVQILPLRPTLSRKRNTHRHRLRHRFDWCQCVRASSEFIKLPISVCGVRKNAHRGSFSFDELVSGISDHSSSTAARALPCPEILRPRLPATRLESVVLSEAPTPDIVPTKPYARLNRPSPL